MQNYEKAVLFVQVPLLPLIKLGNNNNYLTGWKVDYYALKFSKYCLFFKKFKPKLTAVMANKASFYALTMRSLTLTPFSLSIHRLH